MSPILFDPAKRRRVRDRAARIGVEPFLLDRAFDDCLDRVAGIARRFDRALLIGAPVADWPARLGALANQVVALDPGPLFAAALGGEAIDEDRFDFGEGEFDLVVAVGTLDTVNDLPVALQLIRRAMTTDAPLIGAMAGGNSFPMLRDALLAADRSQGFAGARLHPRIDAPTLAQLLAASGFNTPVVDIDRVSIRYSTLPSLVRDLRAMAGSSQLATASPPLNRAAYRTACDQFRAAGDGTKTRENVEILHFLAWS